MMTATERDGIGKIFSSMDTCLCMVSPEMKILWTNEKLKTLFPHFVPEEKTYEEACRASNFPCDQDVVSRAVKTGEPFAAEKFVPEDGKWYHIISRPVFSDQKILEYVLLCLHDITAQKELQSAFLDQKERFLQLVDNLRDIFWIYSPETEQYRYVSPAYKTIVGKSCQSLYDNPASFFDVIDPKDHDRIIATRKKQMQSSATITYHLTRGDGSMRWIRERTFPVYDASGEIGFIAGISEDITEERRLREESEYRYQQILQADKLSSLGEVVAGVAHEINNPNSFIAYNIPLLEETWQIFKPVIDEHLKNNPDAKTNNIRLQDLSSDMGEIIQAIRTGSDRINKVVSNLKDFARLDESEYTTVIDINDVIENTLTIVGAQLRKAAAKIDLHLSENLPKVMGQPQKLEQVMANLLVNAAHAIPEKDNGKISIKTRYIKRLQCVFIEVEDNGTGISPSDIDRIFDPFFTTRREKGGTGLGLSVSYGLIKEHNGIIGVLSRPQQGSRFTILLPTDKQACLDLKPSILCVDDDAQYPNMLRTYFMKVENEHFASTKDPESVIEYMEEHPEVDIVLSDVMMPGMNGWELLEKIKERFPLVNTILYSGHPDALEPKEPKAVTPDHILLKPFKTKELLEIIRKSGRQRL